MATDDLSEISLSEEKMRKIFGALLVFLLVSTGFAQQVIENPEKPPSKNAGRVIHLKEVMRIVDGGKEFYFKLPWGIDVAQDGSIFVQDEPRLYKFGANGKYERNIMKIGQGPGELSGGPTNFIVGDNEVILFGAGQSKLIKIDMKGNLIKDMKLGKKRFTGLVGFYNRKYFFVDSQPRTFEIKDGIQEYDRNLYIMDDEENIVPTLDSFPTKDCVSIRSFGGRTSRSVSYITRLQTGHVSNQYLYVSHTQDYLIKQIDLAKGKVSRIFRRIYPRINNPFPDKKVLQFPEYENDVHRLLVYKNNLWVLTSTFDQKKGILVDVFNEQGKYLDNFYLPLLSLRTGDEFSQRYFPLRILGDFLYTIEHDQDWSFYIVKYEIIDN